MQHKVTIVDYGLGNIFSVSRTFSTLGCAVEIATTGQQILDAQFLVLPGVGAFKKGMNELAKRHFIDPIHAYTQKGKPLLGICLGLQLLFEGSDENGHTEGLSLLPGRVVRIVPENTNIKVPHIGWSRLQINNQHARAQSFSFIAQQFAYFVHSFHPLTANTHVLATTSYHDQEINALVVHEHIMGCQFHPEKSGENFMPFLKAITQADTLVSASAMALATNS